MKNYEVIGNDLLKCGGLGDDDGLSYVADYIACPSLEDCNYDGKNNDCCTECKVRWLQKEWED